MPIRENDKKNLFKVHDKKIKSIKFESYSFVLYLVLPRYI